MRVDRDRRAAFERVFAAHYWEVRDFALRRAPREVAEDAVAETFLIAWRRFDDVESDALPWLLGVARRVLANQFRAERRRGALVERLRSTHVVSLHEPPLELDGELAAAMTLLPAHEREALLLSAWEGLDPRRAAQVVGCSAATFRVRLHRAKRHLANHLTERPAPLAQTRVSQELP